MHLSCVRSRGIPARRESVVHPRSLNSGDVALGFYRYLLARSSQRLSQWHGQNDCEGMLHAAYAEPSDACLLKCVMKPAANDDLFRKLHSRCQGTDSAMAEGPRKMSSRLASETLSLEPRFYTLYNSCYSPAKLCNHVRRGKDDQSQLRRRSVLTSVRSKLRPKLSEEGVMRLHCTPTNQR